MLKVVGTTLVRPISTPRRLENNRLAVLVFEGTTGGVDLISVNGVARKRYRTVNVSV